MRTAAIALVLLVVVVGSGFLIMGKRFASAAIRSSTPVQHSDAEYHNQLETLRREVAALRAQGAVNKVEAERSPVAAKKTISPGPHTEDYDQSEDSLESTEERERYLVEANAARLNDRLNGEAEDPAWANSALFDVRQALSVNAAGSRMVDWKCGETLCRITLEHDTNDMQMELASKISRSSPFASGTFYHYQRGTTTPRTTLYFTREGRSFGDS